MVIELHAASDDSVKFEPLEKIGAGFLEIQHFRGKIHVKAISQEV